MAIFVLGLDDGQHFELPYTFGESQDVDDAVRLALKLHAGQIAYSRIEPEPNGLDTGDLNLVEVERRLIIIALQRSAWCQKDAAILLGITPRQINAKIDRYKINSPIRVGWRKAR